MLQRNRIFVADLPDFFLTFKKNGGNFEIPEKQAAGKAPKIRSK